MSFPIWDMPCKEHNIWCLISGFLPSACFRGSPMLCYVHTPFLFLAIIFCECHIFFIHLPVHAHLRNLYLLAILTTLLGIQVRKFSWGSMFSVLFGVCAPGSRITWQWDNSVSHAEKQTFPKWLPFLKFTPNVGILISLI